MRRFEDDEGRCWDLVVGRESWGSFVALFVPRGEGGSVRQAPLAARGRADAEAAIRDLDREGIGRLFREASPKNRNGAGEGT